MYYSSAVKQITYPEKEMSIRLDTNIIFVKDVQKSNELYEGILGMKVKFDHGTIIIYENGFAVHEHKSIHKTVFKKDDVDRKLGNNNLISYFISDEIEYYYDKIQQSGFDIIHPIEKQSWGEKVFRFYDYDGHIVEIGDGFNTDH